MPDPTRLVPELPNWLAGLQVPQFHHRTLTPRQEETAVWRQARPAGVVGIERAEFPGLHNPKAQLAAAAPAEDAFAIARDVHGPDGGRLALFEAADLRAGLHIPQANGPITAGRHDALAVRTKGHSEDRQGVPLEATDQFPGFEVPEAQVPVQV